ncbi:NADPH-dependent oxidoreductase [Nakamurella antarctica]|uniref:NADPH-dependent oxidoreductase n=1 Tax=Nakamurella antarctica TaxID=1902245 RepID=A0A3G8ZTP7_9ACTN|nr:NAD(P)H-dependent oxidoreductase [Nakamurella antarctica]AZI57171.1 NADPH-dependent oxidoreductase [Nakamurella antarctica]
MLKIALIVSSTRAARFADTPVAWLSDIVAQRDDIDLEIVDLRDYPMPFFDEVASSNFVTSTNEMAQNWQRKIAEFDGYIFLTPEYNHGPTAVLKNALDYSYKEWNRKPAAFVGYGSVGAARSIEALRLVAVAFQMVPINAAVLIQGADFFKVWKHGGQLSELTHLEAGVDAMLADLLWWGNALKTARIADDLVVAGAAQ